MNALLASILLLVTVAMSLVVGVLASYVLVRAVLYSFGSRSAELGPVLVARVRAHAAGGD